MRGVRVERLDHLGLVAGVCQEMGLAAYLDAIAGSNGQRVSVGTAWSAPLSPDQWQRQLKHCLGVGGFELGWRQIA